MQLSLTGVSTIMNEQLESAPAILNIQEFKTVIQENSNNGMFGNPPILFDDDVMEDDVMEIMFSSIVGSEDNNNDAQLDSATITFYDYCTTNSIL